MELWVRGHVALGLALMGLLVLCQMEGSDGLRFVIDREECFSHDAKYQGDTIHVSFVVIKVDSSWHNTEDGVDLVVSCFISFSSSSFFFFLVICCGQIVCFFQNFFCLVLLLSKFQ